MPQSCPDETQHQVRHDEPGPDLGSRGGLAGLTILQVLPSLDEGGVERGTIEMVRAIVGEGGIAIVASAGGRMVPAVERAGGRHVTLPLMTKDPLNILINARRIRRLIVSAGVSLVHARSRAPAWSALLAARRARVPFVTTWHGVYSENFPGKRIYNRVMARGARVIAISDFVAARIGTRYRVGPDRLRVIHRGADLSVFDPARVIGERLHRLADAWRVELGQRIILLPGRMTAWKGHALLVDALAAIADTRAVVVFTGTVDSRQMRSLCVRARALGVEERLRFAGHCADMASAYALATLVVAPSLKPEPFGRVVVEAQAMGRLVIVADHGGAAETVAHGVSGWRVTPGDVAMLAAAIDAGLALSPDELDAFAHSARASVAGRFSTARMQARTVSVYREILHGDPPLPPEANAASGETMCASS